MQVKRIDPDKIRFTDDETDFPDFGPKETEYKNDGPFVQRLEVSDERSPTDHITFFVIPGTLQRDIQRAMTNERFASLSEHDPNIYHREGVTPLKHFHWGLSNQPILSDIKEVLGFLGNRVAPKFKQYIEDNYGNPI